MITEYNDIKKLFEPNCYSSNFEPDNTGKCVVIYPPTIDWGWMKQRPQHIMEQFSLHGYEVYYCNKTQLDEALYTTINPNLKVVHNNYHFIKNVLPKLKEQKRKIILWVSWSKLHLFLKHYSPSFIVYDYIDDFKAWRPYHDKMVRCANVVVASSDVLQSQIKDQYPLKKCCLVRNGCSIKHFNRSSRIPKPTELKNHRGPIITFMGAWADWVDQELVEKMAVAFPSALVIIIGVEFNIKAKIKQPNIVLLGYRPFNKLPQYLKHSSVCIIPFKIQEVSVAANPIKMYEYLASGKHVVSTDVPEVRNIPSVLIGKDHDSFINKVGLILESKIPFNKKEVDGWLVQHTWEKRFIEIQKIFKNSKRLKTSSSKVKSIPNPNTL